MKARSFIDTVIVHACAGNGGNGCVSFRREKFIPKGGPDGGDGGDGGNVILEADREEDSLIRLHYAPHQRAGHGGHGRGKQIHGRNGRDRLIRVPCGTEVWHHETSQLLGDLVEHGRSLIAARGGKGGLGNCHWKTAVHQAPREHTNGGPGEEVPLRLELKLIADAGLVGFPNAGKSSLLAALTGAHPKVAAYPFTTLHPVIGTLVFEDYSRLRVADIPGLLQGAHEGVGLGDAFLRHIERSAMLIFVIDMAGGGTRRPYDAFRILRDELRLHREDLARRPFLVAANKMDLPSSQENLADFRRETGTEPLPVSALRNEGLDALKQAIFRLKSELAL